MSRKPAMGERVTLRLGGVERLALVDMAVACRTTESVIARKALQLGLRLLQQQGVQDQARL